MMNTSTGTPPLLVPPVRPPLPKLTGVTIAPKTNWNKNPSDVETVVLQRVVAFLAENNFGFFGPLFLSWEVTLLNLS